MKKILESIKKYSIKNNNTRILKNYYSKEMRRGKTYRASFIDKFFFYIILFIFLIVILSIKTGKLLLSFYLSVFTMILFTSISGIYLKRKKKNKIKEINEDIKKRKLIKEFSNFNREDFIDYIKNLLEEYYNIKITKEGPLMDLKGVIEEETYGIKCIKIGMEDRVGLRDLENFYRDLRSLGFSDGILITNSYFREDIRENAKVFLYDFDNIVEILKKLDRYPTDEDVENYIIDRFLDKRNSVKEGIKTMDKKKIFQLYGIFVIFYSLSYFINYPKYYKIMAIISFVIASTISGYKISEYIRIKDRFPLK